MHNHYTHIPPEVQEARIWKRSDYISSLWYNAIHTYGLKGDKAAEYVRIEQELDAIEHSPFLETRPGERDDLLRRHAELTNRPNALSRAD